ncbi:MAG TPA: diguanylate cyclase [Pyrinomonadaceae bacterium]|nr:diguanylate cyclase [Pyrinomonadaceae bacterium]
MKVAPAKKERLLDRLAEENGVAIVVVDAEGNEAYSANNNSMCRSLYGSSEFAPECAKFCGAAFDKAAKAGETIEYDCYAGLSCKAVPVWERGTPFVAIVGRTFLKADRYRNATENAISGEWRTFRPTEFFENVLISGTSQNIDRVVGKLEKFSDRERNEVLELERLEVSASPMDDAETIAEPDPREINNLIERFKAETEKAADELENAVSYDVQQDRRAAGEWRSLFGSLMKLEYRAACNAVLSYLQQRYSFDSVVWLERRGDNLEKLVAIGELAEKTLNIGIDANNERLQEAARKEAPVEFRERKTANGVDSDRALSLFPITIGGEVRAAIGVNSRIDDNERRRMISRFAQTLASQLEILRLRDEVARRDWLARAVIKFNENLRRIDAEDFWLRLTQVSAELLGAERASILIRNEKANGLQAKAAIGSRINLLSEPIVGTRVAGKILEIGDPVVVSDINGVGLDSAPADWSYKTRSFLSYPIIIDDRRIGVLNFTDKAGGRAFTKTDLELLQAIAPQIAVAIDRTALKDKAGEYEQLSVTDPLTGLLNRRYLEERITEEITRSKRHRFSLSLMMLDVDDFKAYNDSFGHPAGDSALRIVAEILKETLRGADVAARYGGEEFAILLPQTSSEEAAQIGERIRKRIERTEFPERSVTVSIGIASCSNEVETTRDLISAADVALYAAKNQGRNNVQVFNAWGESVNDNIH